MSKPLSWDTKDTEQTQREIFAHNMKWEKYCKPKTDQK